MVEEANGAGFHALRLLQVAPGRVDDRDGGLFDTCNARGREWCEARDYALLRPRGLDHRGRTLNAVVLDELRAVLQHISGNVVHRLALLESQIDVRGGEVVNVEPRP